MSAATKLTVYCGEQARSGGRLVADALIEEFERHAFRTSVLLRGIEGFGLKHHLHTQRLENLALDLPVVAVAVDRSERVEAALPAVRALVSEGLVTLERAELLDGGAERLTEGPHEETKLTVYCGRGQDYLALVDLLQRHRVDGATVLLGVDGTVRGRRRRARLLGGNAEVPVMLIAVGRGATIAGALDGIAGLVERPLVTLERIRVCKRGGALLAAPEALADSDPGGRPLWQKLMVHTSAPIYAELVRRLRAAGASGATTLRGVWGYHGDHAPHGDRLLGLRRRVPVVTVVVDRPSRARQWFAIIDELTAGSGLVTSETVPAFHATATGGPGLA